MSFHGWLLVSALIYQVPPIPMSSGTLLPADPTPEADIIHSGRSMSERYPAPGPAGQFAMPAPKRMTTPTLASPQSHWFGEGNGSQTQHSLFGLAKGHDKPLFYSDHEFDGFVGPLSNPVQFKDPRSLTEARFFFLNNWGTPNTPVLGSGSIQVYALQLRLAVNERLQLFADKDGIVRLSPNPGDSVTGLANINAGLKYVLIRDVERQFLFSGVLQYEAPTGAASVFQNQGSGNLAIYGVLGKEFADNWHVLLQVGQNFRMKTTNSGYFLTSAHIDRRFGPFVPFFEANWFYFNQNGTFLPLPFEGGGLLNIGAEGVSGLNWVTNAIGFKYDLNKHLELGFTYEFQVSDKVQLLNNMVLAEVILRY